MTLKKCLALAAFAGVLCSCGKVESAPGQDDSETLYRQTVELAGSYARRIAAAPDSAAVDSLFGRFNEVYDSLNMSVAPNTDLLLAGGRNDTIMMALDALLGARAGRLEELAVVPESSEPSDISDMSETSDQQDQP